MTQPVTPPMTHPMTQTLILTRRPTCAYVPLSSRAPSAPVSDLVKYQEQANSAMYFRFNTQLGPPYQILVGRSPFPVSNPRHRHTHALSAALPP